MGKCDTYSYKCSNIRIEMISQRHCVRDNNTLIFCTAAVSLDGNNVTSTPWSWSMLRLAVVVGWRVTDDRF